MVMKSMVSKSTRWTDEPVRDVLPWMEPAGKRFPNPSETGSTKDAVFNTTLPEPPRTPDHLKTFRKSRFAEPGTRTVHPGVAKDGQPPDIRFGRVGGKELGVSSCLTDPTAIGVAAVINDCNEHVYASRKKEPLGKGTPSFQTLPEHTVRPGFAFGKSSASSEGAKALIYTPSEYDDSKKRPIGAAKPRDYDWAKAAIDPTRTRFGRASDHDMPGNTVKVLVEPEVASATRLVGGEVADHIATTNPTLGRTKNLGFGSRPEGPEFTYGKGNRPDRFGARELMSGCGDAPEPDDLLGKSIIKSVTLRKIAEAQQKDRDVSRTFGIPSIRTDIPKPVERRATNGNNYGDESDAPGLLYPTTFTTMGLQEERFSKPLTWEEIKRFAQKVDLGVTEAQLEHAFKVAANGREKISLGELRVAIEQLGF